MKFTLEYIEYCEDCNQYRVVLNVAGLPRKIKEHCEKHWLDSYGETFDNFMRIHLICDDDKIRSDNNGMCVLNEEDMLQDIVIHWYTPDSCLWVVPYLFSEVELKVIKDMYCYCLNNKSHFKACKNNSINLED